MEDIIVYENIKLKFNSFIFSVLLFFLLWIYLFLFC